MKKNLLCLLAVPAILCAVPARAQTFINQNIVNAAGGFPYTISAPGSYQLNGNLTVGSYGVNAINITVPGVTLDLGGYTIGGPMVCSGTSCNSSAYSFGVNSNWPQTVVRNGGVKGFYVCVNNFAPGRTENLNISSCQYGMEVAENVVLHNTVSNCPGYGIYARMSTVQGNLADSNNIGLYANNSSMLNNTATRNTTGLLMSINGGGLFGSNMLLNNTTDLINYNGQSQNNNQCTNGVC